MKILITLLLFSVSFTLFAQQKDTDTLRHTLEVGSRYENFVDRETYRVFNSLLYGYKINGKHDLYGRVIHQNRNGENAVQSMIDFYPTYKRGYMFFSARYSNSILFPKFIGMGEIYYNYADKLESSIGIRYLRPVDDYNIYILTGTFGVYHGNWFTYARPLLNFLDDGSISWSGQISTRRYFGAGKSYVEASFLRGEDTGTTRPVGSIENSFGLDTYLVRLKGNIALPKDFTLAVGSDFSGLFIPKANGDETKINIVAVDFTLKKKF